MATHKAFIDLVNSLSANSMTADELTSKYGYMTEGKESGFFDGLFESMFGSNWISNLFAKYSGSRLTDAERQANAFNAYREDLAFQRQMAASNTAHQREAADLRAAGINPMMSASGGSGAIVPSMPTSGSVAPGSASLNLGGLLTGVLDLVLRAKKLPAEVDNLESQAEKNRADATKTEEDTRGSKLQNDFFERMQDVRAEAEQLENDLKAAEKRSIYKSIDKMDSEISKNIEEAHTEQEKQTLFLQQSILANATAENITAMRPFVQAELSAKAGLELQQTKVAFVDEAYRQKLIDSGSIEASVRLSNASASKSEVDAEVAKVERFLKEYDKHRKAGDLVSWLNTQPDIMDDSVVDGLVGALAAVSSSISGR